MVSYRLTAIKSDYPELLQKDTNILQTNEGSYKNTKVQKFVQICKNEEFVKESEEPVEEEKRSVFSF